MYTKDSRTGELKAASTGIILLDIARTLGARIGVEVLPVGHPTIPEMLMCLTAGACDMGFMGPDPSRAGVDFSPPILQLDYTFLVPAGSSIARTADADRPGVRIAVVHKADKAPTCWHVRLVPKADLCGAAN
jgi:polar amino acid transport system substrate-binding protein